MRILAVHPLPIPDAAVIRFARFADERGWFAETLRDSDLASIPQLSAYRFVQHNESLSHAGVVRGMHVQYDPPLGKMLRCVQGRVIDLLLDLRTDSAMYGRRIAYALQDDPSCAYDEWVWIPPGVAHGFAATLPSRVQYLCTADYNPAGEACIRADDPAIDDTGMDAALRAELHALLPRAIRSAKDRAGMTLDAYKMREK